jgi:hypothetical protein
MPLSRVFPETSVIDVLDHVLDKGVVIAPWVRVSVGAIDLVTAAGHVIVDATPNRQRGAEDRVGTERHESTP